MVSARVIRWMAVLRIGSTGRCRSNRHLAGSAGCERGVDRREPRTLGQHSWRRLRTTALVRRFADRPDGRWRSLRDPQDREWVDAAHEAAGRDQSERNRNWPALVAERTVAAVRTRHEGP